MRLAMLVIAALLSLSIYAYAEDSPVPFCDVNTVQPPRAQLAIWDGRVVDVASWALQDHYSYWVELRLFRGSEQVGVTNGLGAANGGKGLASGGDLYYIAQGEDPLSQRVAMHFMILMDVAGEADPRTGFVVPPMVEEYLPFADSFAFGPLTFHIYAPDADRFEARVYRSRLPADVLVDTGSLLPDLVKHDPESREYIGWLGGSIATPAREFPADNSEYVGPVQLQVWEKP